MHLNGDLFYCGHKLGEKTIPGSSDCRCGPNTGPQCASLQTISIVHGHRTVQSRDSHGNLSNLLSECRIPVFTKYEPRIREGRMFIYNVTRRTFETPHRRGGTTVENNSFSP